MEKLIKIRLHYFTVSPYFSKAETRMITGRSDTIRTCDLYHPKVALCQAETRPDLLPHDEGF